MQVNELIGNKYVFLRNGYHGLEFWKESAVGYTDLLFEAGIYSEEDIKHFNMRYFKISEIRKGSHKKCTHFAVSLFDAMLILFTK